MHKVIWKRNLQYVWFLLQHTVVETDYIGNLSDCMTWMSLFLRPLINASAWQHIHWGLTVHYVEYTFHPFCNHLFTRWYEWVLFSLVFIACKNRLMYLWIKWLPVIFCYNGLNEILFCGTCISEHDLLTRVHLLHLFSLYFVSDRC